MTRFTYLLLLSTLLLIFSCSGGSVKKDPAPMHPAMKQLQKGLAWYPQGCFQQSLEAFTKAHELFTASDRLPGVAMSLNNIGNVYRYIGDSQSALLFFQESYLSLMTGKQEYLPIISLSFRIYISHCLSHPGSIMADKAVIQEKR